MPSQLSIAILSDYAKTGIKNNGSDACMRHVLQHSAAIVNSVRLVGVNRYTGERGDSEVPGSGCPMRWGKHYFVLSAAHVFENAEAKDIRVLAFADLPKEYKSREALTKMDVVDGVPLSDGAVIHRCKWEDLAVVTVDRAKFPGVDFVDPEKNWTDPPPGENVNCCGFPSDHGVVVNRKAVSPKRDEADIAIWPTLFGAAVLPFPSDQDVMFYYDGLRPDRHYLIGYDCPNVSKDPHGLSGAAVWWESDEKKIIWHPNFRFAGTVTHSHRHGAIVRVVKASVVRQFLAELFGSPSV